MRPLRTKHTFHLGDLILRGKQDLSKLLKCLLITLYFDRLLPTREKTWLCAVVFLDCKFR